MELLYLAAGAAPQPSPSIAQWLECGAPESFRGVSEKDMAIALEYFAAPQGEQQ
jgi:hypothetical protein